MREWIRTHLTYANAMSTLAVFLVIGGGTALGAFVITSNSQVAPGTISGHHPPAGDHANIIADSINGQDVAPDRLGGGQINESTLSKVPNADALDGIDSTGFIQGSGRIVTIDTSAVGTGSTTLFDLPGFAKMFGLCDGLGNPAGVSVSTYSQSVAALSTNGAADAHHDLAANAETGSSDWNLTPNSDSIDFSLSASGGKIATAFISEYTFNSPILHKDVCKFQGHVIVSGA